MSKTFNGGFQLCWLEYKGPHPSSNYHCYGNHHYHNFVILEKFFFFLKTDLWFINIRDTTIRGILVKFLFALKLFHVCRYLFLPNIHTHTHTHTRTHTHTHTHTHIYIYIYTHTHIHTYIHTYIHIYTHTYTYTYTYTYIHSYRYRYMSSWIHKISSTQTKNLFSSVNVE